MNIGQVVWSVRGSVEEKENGKTRENKIVHEVGYPVEKKPLDQFTPVWASELVLHGPGMTAWCKRTCTNAGIVVTELWV
jgi:hypothetical protein